MTFEKHEIILLRRTAEEYSRDWEYPLMAKPAFILCCEIRNRKVTTKMAGFNPDLTKQMLKDLTWIDDRWVFRVAEQWRRNIFNKHNIAQGRVMFAVCTPSKGVNRELESHLYQWWSAKREYMLGDFFCIDASEAN
jgi:hypothetical protein